MPPEKLLPEIASLVASYLPTTDLARCVQVSHSWRDVFLPHRWRVVSAGVTAGRRRGPHPNEMYDHRHLVHDLSIFSDFSGLEGHDYPFVRKLFINGRPGLGPKPRLSFSLIEMFPLLVNLHIKEAYVEKSTWSTLPCSHITHLNLYATILSRDFWKACSQLEMLTLNRIAFCGYIPRDACFQLRTLDIRNMDMDEQEQLELIRQCHKLETVNWKVDRTDYDFDDPTEVDDLYTDHIKKGCWPHLISLFISHELQDTNVASILGGIGQGDRGLINLRLSGYSSFEEQASKALYPHFKTLVTIDFSYDCCYKSYAIRDILCSCSSLEILYIKSVLARDVVTGGPWVCQRLRELRVCFMFEESEQDLQQQVFGHLSTLIGLERLEMERPDFESFECEEVLEFRLECGLGQLAGLQKLITLIFRSFYGDYIPQLGRKDAEWMLANWNLKRISGIFHEDEKENREVSRLFRDHSIMV